MANDIDKAVARLLGMAIESQFITDADAIYCVLDKLAAYREMNSQLSRIAFEKWHGHYQNDVFWIFDSDGEGIASGDTPLDAYRAMKEKV